MTKKSFNFYKIAVEPTDNLHLFANHDKGQIIKDAFTIEKPVEFVHFTVTYAYTKVAQHGDYIIGYLGKKSVAKIGGPPEKLFEPTTTESWKKVLMVVNTSTQQPYGQTIALQKDVSVFDTPLIQLNGLIKDMTLHNDKLDGYELIVNSVISEESFWKIVKSKTGKIEKLSFNLAAPNFLGLKTSLADSMRDVQKNYNATTAELIIGNPSGGLKVPEGDKFINEAVEYASGGQGDIQLEVLDEGKVDPKRNVVSAKIETMDTKILVESSDPETIKQICDTLFSCLKR